MNLLVALIVGGIVGWLAGQVGGRDEGVFASIVIGVIGSFIGSFLSVFLTGSDRAYLAFTWQGFIWSLGGAVLLVLILNAFHGRHHSEA